MVQHLIHNSEILLAYKLDIVNVLLQWQNGVQIMPSPGFSYKMCLLSFTKYINMLLSRVMIVSLPSVCLFVCLSVPKISQELICESTQFFERGSSLKQYLKAY